MQALATDQPCAPGRVPGPAGAEEVVLGRRPLTLAGRLRAARRAGRPGRSQKPSAVVRRAVIGHMAVSVVFAAVLGLASVVWSNHLAQRESLREARWMGRAVASGIVAPMVDERLHRGEATAVAQLDRAVRSRMEADSIIRVKVWDDAGRILYSDERRLVGKRFDLSAGERELMRTGGSAAELSDLTRPENLFEPAGSGLIEVYAGTWDSTGEPILVEVYLPLDIVRSTSSKLQREMLLVTLSAFVVLQLLQFPIAISLARRVQRRDAERARLLRNAVTASQIERRRVAQDLHDGVIQDLAGLGYALTAAERQLPEDSPPNVRASLTRAGAIVRRDVAALRTMLTDIYPPDLAHGGLPAALGELLRPLREQGVSVRAVLPGDLDLPELHSTVLYRIAREALRNVERHAGARYVELLLSREGGEVALVVADDGSGFDVARAAGPAEGHLGLRLLSDAAEDVGGTLTVRSALGQGTRVSARLAAP